MSQTATTFAISDLAREFSITPRTIRFWEDQGILAPQREGSKRVFTRRDRARLKMALRGKRLSGGQPLTIYPGEVPARLPGQAFWQQQGFQFENFRPQVMDVDRPLPHIRLDAALEFLIGDKLR